MSSRPATLEQARAAGAPEPELSLAPPPAERPRRLAAPKPALAAIFLVAAGYHALQSRWHVSPAIFTDELLYSKLAQGLAAGEGFVVRGEPLFFPAALPTVAQAPAWLVENVPTAYALAKALNALVMASAAFPAYWLARQLVRPSWALLTAAATVAAPAMLYHSYLLSEALGYPVFLLALAVMLRSLAAPSPRWGLAVIGVSLLAIGTRAQFAVLPLAYLGCLLACRRSELRRHGLPAGGLLFLGTLGLLTGGAALGPYFGAVLLDFSPADILRWSALTGALLPFAAGWLVLPGALCGLACLLARPRGRPDRPFAVLAVTLIALVLGQAGLVAALEAERAIERYAIYLVPLLFVAFFAYAERAAPRRRAYGALALALGSLAWLVPFPSLADYLFSFDSPTLSAYGMLAVWLSHGDAATVFAGVPLLAGLLLAVLPVRGRAPSALVGASLAVMVLVGAAAYAGDHGMTRRTLRAWAGSPPDWLDRSGLGRADYLLLPGASPHFGWTLEAWNRSFGRFTYLGVREPFEVGFASSRAQIVGGGRLLVDGEPYAGGLLAVNDWATDIELEGEVLARPRGGLTLYRTPRAPRVRSLAAGVFFDGWAGGTVRYQVWPDRPTGAGTYRVVLQVPRGWDGREVKLQVRGGARRRVYVRPGRPVLVELPASGDPVPFLLIRTNRANFVGGGTPNPRLVALRIPLLEYVPAGAPARRSP